MNITVTVDEVSLDTAVGEVLAYDDEGCYPHPEPRTVGMLVADRIVEMAAKSSGWQDVTKMADQIRGEVIREVVRPQIEEALGRPFRKTNTYGEPVGEPVTLRELIVDEVQRVLRQPADTYSREKGTVLEVAVRKEVADAFGNEVRDAVKQAREGVADEIGRQVINAVSAAMKGK